MFSYSGAGPWWGGPMWGGPMWGGLHPGVLTDPVSSAAMALTRETLVAYSPIQSDVVAPSWESPMAAPVARSDPSAIDEQLLAYSPSVRIAIIVGELVGALSVSGNSDRVVLGDGNATIALLEAPGAYLASEIAQTKNIVATVRGQKVLPMVNTLLAQDQDPLAPFMYVLGMGNGTRLRTAEVLAVANEALGSKIFAMKHRLRMQRPQVYDAEIVPLLSVPSHLSYPGGHAAKGFLAATLLKALVGARPGFAKTIDTLAALVGDNRVNAGLHFPVDTAAGEVLGSAFGHWLIATAGPGRSDPWSGAGLRASAGGGGRPLVRAGQPQTDTTADIQVWRTLWAAAAAEW